MSKIQRPENRAWGTMEETETSVEKSPSTTTILVLSIRKGASQVDYLSERSDSR